MQQLTELDYNFVLQETSRTPMHISPIVIYEQLPGRRKVRYPQVLQAIEFSLHKSAVFRRKLAGESMGFDAPYWVEDPDFNLEYHVNHIALPKPGDWRQLCILLARLHSRGLNMKRPLWEAWVIEGLSQVEGLPKDSFAIMFKVHHAAIDGVSGAEIVTAIHSLDPNEHCASVDDDWEGESEPSALKVWSTAYRHSLQRPMKFVSTLRDLVPNIVRATREREDEPVSEMVRTRFNGEVSSARVTDALVLELDEIKRLRHSVEGATVNDVMISIVGGGLRKYLKEKGELPDVSLSCGAPISTRAERGSDSVGNQVGQMTISMATDIDDPLKRLAAVHDSAVKAKEFTSAVGSGLMSDITQGMMPNLLGFGMRTGSRLAARSEMPVPSHVIISNVQGPPFAMYLEGAPVHLMMGMGPILHMMGMFHAVLSGAGKISITFVTCREMMPDPAFYKACLNEAYSELLEAVGP